MIISGANNLYNNKKEVDDLNVFPVPDGDTGTNMSLTSAAIAAALAEAPTTSATKAADKMQFAALRGARGNSGVILSQIFRGIAKNIKGKDELSAPELAKALEAGSAAAYKAVMKPTEGTILTVARESATGALLCSSNDITDVIKAAVERGEKALADTPKQLAALAQAGVVDAGGKGWMCVLEGVLYYLETGTVIERVGGMETEAPKTPSKAQESISTEDITFQYCTEFLIEKYNPQDSSDSFRDAIAPKGDSMLVIDDNEIVKVHIHTNNPGFVLEEAVKLGELINLKIDNMKHQHRAILDSSPKPVKVEVEVKKPLIHKKAPQPEKDYGFVAVCAGKGLAKVLKDLDVDKIIEGGQTMNPSTDDILKAINKVHAKTVFVFPNNKNIIMAAEQAAQICEDKKVVVIPSKDFPRCVSALVTFNAKKDAEANEKAMIKALDKVQTGQITYAVRDTEIDDVVIKKDDIIGIIEGKITLVGKDINDILDKMIEQMSDEDTEFVTVYTGKDVKKNQIEDAQKALAKLEDDEIEVSFKKGSQPLYYYIVSVE